MERIVRMTSKTGASVPIRGEAGDEDRRSEADIVVSGMLRSSHPVALVDDIRAEAARIAGSARHVRIVEDAISTYAQTLAVLPPPPEPPSGDPEARAAASLTLNAVNFGSGWFPTLRKPPGLSGFRTVEAALGARGPWSAEELRRLDARAVAAALDQDPDHELMALYAAALNELGERVGDSFLALARSGNGSAVALAEQLASWPGWRDPFAKRAQIAAWDLHREGIAPAGDTDRLTLFADNLVPHVLRIDGVLAFGPDLVARIDDEQLLVHGSPEETEIRACAIHAVELLVAAHGDTTAAEVDLALWLRGGGERYKEHPRHRARTTAY